MFACASVISFSHTKINLALTAGRENRGGEIGREDLTSSSSFSSGFFKSLKNLAASRRHTPGAYNQKGRSKRGEARREEKMG